MTANINFSKNVTCITHLAYVQNPFRIVKLGSLDLTEFAYQHDISYRFNSNNNTRYDVLKRKVEKGANRLDIERVFINNWCYFFKRLLAIIKRFLFTFIKLAVSCSSTAYL